MKCRNPYVKDGMAFGCGQCMPCRVDRRRVWTHRIMLESKLYSDNCMANLTYDDEHLPRLEDGRGTLVPKHLQDWLKRFRKEISPLKIRFFAAGEYGERFWRPHFHVILFNYPNCRYGQSRYSEYPKVSKCCDVCELVKRTWGKGGVFLNEVNDATAQYTCGYVTKKMTDKDDVRLKGLHPEFSRMSLKPGIGADFMWEVGSTLLQHDLVDGMVDVPSTLRHSRRLLPLGSYLQGKLREVVGREKAAPQAVLDAIKEELRPLREAAFDKSSSFKKEVIEAADQAVANMEARQKIFKQWKDKL